METACVIDNGLGLEVIGVQYVTDKRVVVVKFRITCNYDSRLDIDTIFLAFA